MNARENSLERALENAVSRALRDNLAPLQRTANELQQAYADLVAACGSTRPSNALPAMLRAQTAAAALAAGLSVLSNFVAVALNPREGQAVDGAAGLGLAEEGPAPATEWSDSFAHEAHPTAEPSPDPIRIPESLPEPLMEQGAQPSMADVPEAPVEVPGVPEASVSPHFEVMPEAMPEATPEATPEPQSEQMPPEVPPIHTEAPPETTAEAAGHQIAAFDVGALSSEMQDLHRRANRVAKVTMQDIKLLRPKDVEAGREHKDLCHRLRADLDKARKEYDRRFRAISDHPIDYFHHWMLEILAGGDSSALGEYPYPSTVLRH